MKVKDAIAAADAVKPNAFSEETKFQWLRRLEGRLQAEVFLMAPAQVRELDLQYPADMDRELLVDPPYDDLYPLYLQARIDAVKAVCVSRHPSPAPVLFPSYRIDPIAADIHRHPLWSSCLIHPTAE